MEQFNTLQSPDKMVRSVKDYFAQLKSMKSEFPKDGRKFVQIYINQLDDILCNIAKYLSTDPVLTEVFLDEIGEFEVGNSDKRNLMDLIKRHNTTTVYREDGISLATLRQIFSVMNSIHELNGNSCIAALLNLSNTLYHFKLFLRKFAIASKGVLHSTSNYQMITLSLIHI